MAYRNNVASVIYGRPEKIDAFITLNQLVLSNPSFATLHNHIRRYETEDELGGPVHILHLDVNNTTWDVFYNDTQSWMEAMRKAPEMGLEYEFIRVGEDPTDIQIDRSNDLLNYIFLRRPTIQIDFDDTNEVPTNIL